MRSSFFRARLAGKFFRCEVNHWLTSSSFLLNSIWLMLAPHPVFEDGLKVTEGGTDGAPTLDDKKTQVSFFKKTVHKSEEGWRILASSVSPDRKIGASLGKRGARKFFINVDFKFSFAESKAQFISWKLQLTPLNRLYGCWGLFLKFDCL